MDKNDTYGLSINGMAIQGYKKSHPYRVTFWKRRKESKQAVIRKTEVLTIGYDNEVVEHFDIEQLGRPTDLYGQEFVLLARFEVARGVVMGKDDAHTQGLEYHTKKNAQIYNGTRDAPIGDLIGALDPIGIIEQKDLKGFFEG